MPLSKNLATYTAVQQVLDTAKQAGAARMRLETPGKATNWRQRAYKYRRLLWERAANLAGNPPGFVATSPYDNMLLTCEGCDVLIEFRHETAFLLDSKGKKELKLVTTPALVEPPMTADASGAVAGAFALAQQIIDEEESDK